MKKPPRFTGPASGPLPDVIAGAWCARNGCVSECRWSIDGVNWCNRHRPRRPSGSAPRYKQAADDAKLERAPTWPDAFWWWNLLGEIGRWRESMNSDWSPGPGPPSAPAVRPERDSSADDGDDLKRDL